MDRPSMVLDVEVEHEGTAHTACYFVEHGVVHAKIGEGILLVPLLGADAAEVVKSLLLSHLQKHLQARLTLDPAADTFDVATALRADK